MLIFVQIYEVIIIWKHSKSQMNHQDKSNDREWQTANKFPVRLYVHFEICSFYLSLFVARLSQWFSMEFYLVILDLLSVDYIFYEVPLKI